MSFDAAILFSLISACLFGLGEQVINLGLRHADSRTGTMLSIAGSAGFYWLTAPFFVPPPPPLHPAVLIFMAAGLVRPFLSANLALAGTRYLGPTLAATIASTSPLFAAVIGILWLDESLTWPLAIGTLVIVGAMGLLARPGRTRTDWPLWSLSLPVGAAVIRAFGHALSKVGLSYVPSAHFAGLVSVTVSFLLALASERFRGEARPRISWRRPGLAWFVLAGLINGISLLSLNTALKTGELIVVAPIVAAAPFVSLILSRYLFRAEVLTRRGVIALLLIVPAVMLIAMGA